MKAGPSLHKNKRKQVVCMRARACVCVVCEFMCGVCVLSVCVCVHVWCVCVWCGVRVFVFGVCVVCVCVCVVCVCVLCFCVMCVCVVCVCVCGVCMFYELRKRLILSLKTEGTKGKRLILQPCKIYIYIGI
jgi:hypothetical protein